MARSEYLLIVLAVCLLVICWKSTALPAESPNVAGGPRTAIATRVAASR